MSEKIIIYKPTNKGDVLDHVGDTFRELLDMWQEAGYCIIKRSPDHQIWWGNIENGIMLFDRPTLDFLTKPYKLGLFGNPVPPRNTAFNTPWIFWGRSPRLLEKKINENNERFPTIDLDFKNRSISSIFIGRIENTVQQRYRQDTSWRKCIEKFELTIGKTPKYTQQEYLELLTKSKFGLCLRGFGPKCNREIELLGLGVVPLLGPGVDTTYWEPLLDGIHYFRVGSPEQVVDIIKIVLLKDGLKCPLQEENGFKEIVVGQGHL